MIKIHSNEKWCSLALLSGLQHPPLFFPFLFIPARCRGRCGLRVEIVNRACVVAELSLRWLFFHSSVWRWTHPSTSLSRRGWILSDAQFFLYVLRLPPTLKALDSAPFIIHGRLAIEINDDNEASGSGWREAERQLKEGKTNGEGTSLLPSVSEPSCNEVPRSLQKYAGNQISRVSFNRGVSQDRQAVHVCGLMSESAEFRKPASTVCHFLCLGPEKRFNKQ